MGERAIPEDLPSAREIIGTRGGDGGASPKVMYPQSSSCVVVALARRHRHIRARARRAPQPLTKIY